MNPDSDLKRFKFFDDYFFYPDRDPESDLDPQTSKWFLLCFLGDRCIRIRNWILIRIKNIYL